MNCNESVDNNIDFKQTKCEVKIVLKTKKIIVINQHTIILA